MTLNDISIFVTSPHFIIGMASILFVLFIGGILQDGKIKDTIDGVEYRGNGTPYDKELYNELKIGGTPMHWVEYEQMQEELRIARRQEMVKNIGQGIDNLVALVKRKKVTN